jgi:GGDEF domain-containing protein
MHFFGDSLLCSAYESLFEISVELVQNKSWKNIEQKYGVEGNEGCLVKLANAILEKVSAEQVDPKVRQVCRIALENFLILSVGDDPSVYLKATAQEIINKIDAKIFRSTSSYFLREVIYELVKREESAIPDQIRNDLYELSRYRADDIVSKFENRFKKSGNVSFRSLFRFINDNSDWFVPLLRKGR